LFCSLGAPLKEESALKRVTLYLVAELSSVSESDSLAKAWLALAGSLSR
jgi:hypothetical protein